MLIGAACGNATPGTPTSGTPSGGTRTAVDLAGRHVQIPANVTRVATSISATPSLIALLGGTSKLVYRPSPTFTPLLQSVVPAFTSIPSFASVTDFNSLPTITVETLLAWNPQYIFVNDLKTQQLFMSDPQYATLDAVRNHHVDTYIGGVGIQSALLPLSIAKDIHPDLFASVDLTAEVKNFYSKFYNYQPTAQQLQGILNGTLND